MHEFAGPRFSSRLDDDNGNLLLCVGRREDPAAPAGMERKFARAAVNCDKLLILNECEHSSEDLFAGEQVSIIFDVVNGTVPRTNHCEI